MLKSLLYSCYPVSSEILSSLMAWCASYVAHGGNESSMGMSSGLLRSAQGGQVASTVNGDAEDQYVDYSNR